jgi:hypothetical protein
MTARPPRSPHARLNPKDGVFALGSGDRTLAEFSRFLDANLALSSARMKAALTRTGGKKGQLADTLIEIDSALFLAWREGKTEAERTSKVAAALRAFDKARKRDTKTGSLTGTTEDGADTDIELEGVSARAAESAATQASREAKQRALLATYNLTPEMYTEIKELVASAGPDGLPSVSKRNAATLAQKYGVSTRDMETFFALGLMLFLLEQRDTITDRDTLESMVDALT